MRIFYCCLDSFLNTLHVTLDKYIRCNSFFFLQLPHIIGLTASFSQCQMLGISVLLYHILVLFCFILFELQYRILCLLSIIFDSSSQTIVLRIKLLSYSTLCHLVSMMTKTWPLFLAATVGSLRSLLELLTIFHWFLKCIFFSHFYLFEIMS